MIDLLEGGVGLGLRVGAMAEDAEGDGAVNSFPQLDEEQGQFVSFVSETVSVAVWNTLDQAVEVEFADVIADLVESIVLGFESALVQDGVAELGGRPTFEMAAGTLEQNLQQSENAFLFELDAGDFGFALDDGLGQSGQDVQLAMDVEVLSLDGSEAVGDLAEALPHRIPMGQGLLELKVADFG